MWKHENRIEKTKDFRCLTRESKGKAIELKIDRLNNDMQNISKSIC